MNTMAVLLITGALAVVAWLGGTRDPRYLLGIMVIAAIDVPSRPPLYPALAIGVLALPLVVHHSRPHPGFGAVVRVAVCTGWVIGVINLVAMLRGNEVGDLQHTAGVLLQSTLISLSFVAVWNRFGMVSALGVLRFVGLVSVGAGLFQLAQGSFLFKTDYLFLGRFTFPGVTDSNYSALYLMLFLSACVGIRQERRHRSGLSIAIFAVALAATLSRTGLIAAAATLVALFAVARPQVKILTERMRIGVVAATGLGLAVVTIAVVGMGKGTAVTSSIVHRAHQYNDARLSDKVNTFDLRSRMWKQAISQVGTTDGLIGKGDIDVIKWNEAATGNSETLHSFPLTIYVKYGVVGLLLIFASYGYLLYQSRRLLSSRDARVRGVFSLALLLSYGVMVLTISDQIGLHLVLAASLATTVALASDAPSSESAAYEIARRPASPDLAAR